MFFYLAESALCFIKGYIDYKYKIWDFNVNVGKNED